MTLQGKICWDRYETPEIINPYAEHISPAIFRFVHAERDINVTSPQGTSFQAIRKEHYRKMSHKDFLESFLDQSQPHVLATILGSIGTGKSHLVHWMKFNIPKNDNHVVIVVRKSGTSLRQIVKQIIEELPADKQTPFLDTYNAAGEVSLSFEAQKHVILNQLQTALVESYETRSNDIDPLREELLECLPSLLLDPYLRNEYFSRDNTIVSDLAKHVFSLSRSEDRPSERREFTKSDIPLSAGEQLQMAKPAREAVQLLQLDQDALDFAVHLLNEHLDTAISRAMNFSGEIIEQLMVELRKYLKQQDKELILLVEEFARLQGIDRTLLQTITTQGGEDQCKMRTAIAVTTGFFESVQDTAYIRTTHIVNMDLVSDNTIAGVSKNEVAHFVSRYLNAARVGLDRITGWSKDNENDFTAEPISKCDTCEVKGECHSIFGSVNNVGLYPFTEEAIWNLSARTIDGFPQKFNPRTIQRALIKSTLENFSEEIRTAVFPSSLYLQRFGGSKSLSQLNKTKLKSIDDEASERWIPFLEIYDGSDQIVNLSSDLMRVLGIQLITDATERDPVKPPPVREKSDELSRKPVVDNDEVEINKWAMGEKLSQNLTGKLNSQIHQMLADSIRWDDLNLLKAHFSDKSGTKKAFVPQSIVFENQVTRENPNISVKLKINCTPENAVAMQAILKFFKNDKTWNFDEALNYFFTFNKVLTEWRKQIEEQILATRCVGSDWDSCHAALEVLLIGAAMSGLIKDDSNALECLNSVFDDWSQSGSYLCTELNSVYSKILRHKEYLISEFLAFTKIPKGGGPSIILNPEKFFDHVKKFKRGSWVLLQKAPKGLKNELTDLYSEINEGIQALLIEERNLRVDWLREMQSNFGDLSKKDIMGQIEGFLSCIESNAISTGQKRQVVESVLEDFKGKHYDDAIKSMTKLAETEVEIGILKKFGGARSGVMTSSRKLSSALKALYEAAEHRMDYQNTIASRDVQEAIEARNKLATSIETLRDLLMDTGEQTYG